MGSRASLAVAVCLVLAVGRGWAADPDNPAAAKNRPPAKDADNSSPLIRPTYSLPPDAVRSETQGLLVVGAPPPPDAAVPGPPGVAVRGAEPPMMSDLVGQFSRVNSLQRVTVSVPTTRAPGLGFLTQANLAAIVHVPVAGGSAFQAADNESARPLDRAFVTFGYFRDPVLPAIPIGPSGGALPAAAGLSGFAAPIPPTSFGPGSQQAVSFLQQLAAPNAFQPQYQRYVQAALAQGNFVLSRPDLTAGAQVLANASGGNFLTTANRALLQSRTSDQQFQALVSGVLVQSGLASVPLAGLKVFDKPFNRSDGSLLRTSPNNTFREVFGFEKTFLDGNASVGLRMPVFQDQGYQATGLEGVGDVTVLLKYALLTDPNSGNLFSVGLAVTAPTGPDLVAVPGGSSIHPALLQPFVAGAWHYERLYAQGFSALVIPTDGRDATLVLNDLGLGYELYRNPASDLLTGVIPSLEMHFSTPLTHRGLNAPFVGALDSVVVAGGLHLTFFHRLCLTAGASFPLTGPHPTDFGGFAQVNVVF